VTPGEVLGERTHDVFCERAVLAAINELADFSHSKAMADLVTAGKWRQEMLMALGKVAPPRYAHFIGRYKDDADPNVRSGVAAGLGLIDNDAVSIPVLVQLLTRGTKPDDLAVKWQAGESLITIGKRKNGDTVRRRLGDLLQDPDRITVTIASRALAMLGDARGLAKLRDLTGDPDVRVRQDAVLSLADAPDTGSKEALLRRLGDDSLSVRASAMHALGALRDPSVVPALRQALQASIEYERELERRKDRGESLEVLREKYGLGAFELRQTADQAIAAAQSKP
jgi:HEAT repeat protein